ncbi:cytochrome P450 [Sphingomonas profundi]|uniref:cytochrome P450 n=1 Tax=Alterirhizorhabdus profundi TaxID=2681549 RepID=UPI0012E7C018|nr:cytochrome P450 [Sphingomonas profundi]
MPQALAAPPSHVPPERIVDFDVYAPDGATESFHAAWKRLQDPGVPDIVWTPRNGGHWMATRGRIINALFADHEHFSNRVIVVPKEIGELHKMIPTTIDPPEHRPYRNLLNAGMAPKAIMRMEPTIQRLAAELTEAVRPLGACNFTTAYAERFPIEIFMTLVGLPIEDAPMMKRWSDAIVRPTPELGFEQATRNFEGYFGEFVDRRAAAPGDDMLSQMIVGEVAGRPMTKHESVQLCSQILIAGLDTVVNFLGFAMLFLARNPDQRRALVADPALIPRATDELFRRFPLVAISREVRDDIDYEGVALKRGDMITLPTQLHGMDEQENDDPLAVDFQRKRSRHSTFGNGPHRCPGAHLARTEVMATLTAWLTRIPEFEVEPGAVVTQRSGIVGCVDALPLVWDVATTRAIAPA